MAQIVSPRRSPLDQGASPSEGNLQIKSEVHSEVIFFQIYFSTFRDLPWASTLNPSAPDAKQNSRRCLCGVDQDQRQEVLGQPGENVLNL